MNNLSGQLTNFTNELSINMPFPSMPTNLMGSDLMQTKLDGLSNVFDILKNRKSITQSIALLTVNIVLDMIENALELEPQTISDQFMEVLRVQIQDAVLRTNFNAAQTQTF
jgi:hypothetical protein